TAVRPRRRNHPQASHRAHPEELESHRLPHRLVRPHLIEQVDVAALRNGGGLVTHDPREHGRVDALGDHPTGERMAWKVTPSISACSAAPSKPRRATLRCDNGPPLRAAKIAEVRQEMPLPPRAPEAHARWCP